MPLILRSLCASLVLLVLAGCAGTNFRRPEPQTLRVGQSSAADVRKVMGSPREEGEGLVNEQKVRTLQYAYAEAGGQGLEKGVVPARAMTFTTHADMLVGEVFVSSFQQDATDFDERKMASIVKGKTTRAEVTAMLGRPHGHVTYPLVKEKGHTGVVYSYSHAKGTVFDMKFYRKSLLVGFTPQDVVSEVEYQSSGAR